MVQITFIDTLICKCFVVQLIEILAFQYTYETYLTWSHKIDVSIPLGLLAQVVSSHLSDFKLRGCSPCINTYLATR